MEEISFIDSFYNLKSLNNIKKRKITFEIFTQNKKKISNNEINILTNNFNNLRLKRKAEDDQNENIKKIKIINDNNNNKFIPIENNLKRKNDNIDDIDDIDDIYLNKLDGLKLDSFEKITKKIKLTKLEEIVEKDNILSCNCIKICQCDYDYDYMKLSNKKLPPDDMIYRYIN